MSNSLPEHLERFLGAIEHGYTDDQGRRLPFEIVRCSGRVSGGVPFATLGLSRHRLLSDISGKQFHEEVIMIVPEEHAALVPGILHQVASEVLASHSAFLQGRVIGPRNILFPGTAMEALYTAAPVYLPDEFATFHGQEYNVIIPWLIPITHAEAHYVFDHGWQAFEEQLMEHDPELVRLDRPSIV